MIASLVGGTPRVRLDLDLKEFLGLLALHYEHGGGKPKGVRGSIEMGLFSAADLLADQGDESLEDLVDSVRDYEKLGTASGGWGGYTYEKVDALWKEWTA